MLRLLDQRLADNIYAVELDAQLPRVLSLIDRDRLSRTHGFADRQFWGWKLIDFPNGTFQGFANGLSALLEARAFGPDVSTASITEVVETIMTATPKLMRADGSFEEALPFEQSYCVTALVLYDHLKALKRLPASRANPEDLERASRFLVKRDETHGFISNHLATAAAALFIYDNLIGSRPARMKAERLLTRILERQSDEGWFEEYGGADPGYQTLCMTHLSDVADIVDSPRLWSALKKGTHFLCNFAHPDGSFSGVYGSRATRIYYPAAMEKLRLHMPEAGNLADYMRNGIRKQATVTLSAIDQPNLSPVFNNYAEALLLNSSDDPPATASPAPMGRRVFQDAGLLVDVGPHHHSVISTRKTVVYHFADGRSALADCGIAVKDKKGNMLTSQGDPSADVTICEDQIRIQGRLKTHARPLPNPFNFLLLRILSLSVMRIPPIAAYIKRKIARLLMETRPRSSDQFSRTIQLGRDLVVTDSYGQHLEQIQGSSYFSTIHMASSGYWQASDTSGASR